MTQPQGRPAPLDTNNPQIAMRAVAIYCLVLIGGLVALTAALPNDIAAFMTHLGFALPIVYGMASRNYSQYFEPSMRNTLFNALFIVICMGCYYIGQRWVNGAYPAPEHYLGPDLVNPALIIVGMAAAALIVVRRLVWSEFRFHL